MLNLNLYYFILFCKFELKWRGMVIQCPFVGMLMVIAWLGLASMGVYMARYRRNIRDIAVEFQDDTWFKVRPPLLYHPIFTIKPIYFRARRRRV